MIRNRYLAAVNDKPWWLAGGIPQSACVAAYQAKGASSLAASQINLANPGLYTLTMNGSPTWNIGGWTSVTNSGFATGITPAYDGSWSMIAKVFNCGATGYIAAAGSYINGGAYPGFYLAPYWNENKVHYNNGGDVGVAPALASGVLAVSKNKGYRNGVVETEALANAGGNAVEIYLLTLYNSSGQKIGNLGGGYLCSISIYKAPLTDYQVVAVGNEMP